MDSGVARGVDGQDLKKQEATDRQWQESLGV